MQSYCSSRSRQVLLQFLLMASLWLENFRQNVSRTQKSMSDSQTKRIFSQDAPVIKVWKE